MEMRLGLNHLQCSHLVRAVHVEPEAQVTQTDTGWKWTPGRHLGDVPFPLNGWVYVQEFPPATFEAQNGSHLYSFTWGPEGMLGITVLVKHF